MGSGEKQKALGDTQIFLLVPTENQRPPEGFLFLSGDLRFGLFVRYSIVISKLILSPLTSPG